MRMRARPIFSKCNSLRGGSLRPLLTEALTFAQRAVELDPSDPLIQTIGGAWQLMIERDFDGGLARHEEAFSKESELSMDLRRQWLRKCLVPSAGPRARYAQTCAAPQPAWIPVFLDGAAIRAVAEWRSGSRNSKASSERLPATLARLLRA